MARRLSQLFFCIVAGALLPSCGDDDTPGNDGGSGGVDARVADGATRDAAANNDATAGDNGITGDAGPTADGGNRDASGGDASGGDASTSGTIGPGGGTVDSSNGSVTIPAGALSADVEIGVAESATPPTPLPGEYAAASPIYAFTPHGTTFAMPVTLSLAFSGSADTVLVLDGPADTTWDVVATPVIAGSTATVMTSSFSFYVVARSASANVVQPFYPGAPNWNEYVINDGADWFSATNAPCTNAVSATKSSYSQCIHGGEMRAAPVMGRSSCANLTATDALSAFEWTCVVRNNVATMVSTKLKEDVRMAALLDFTSGAWRPNSITFFDGGTGLSSTPMEQWWTNPVVIDNDGIVVESTGTIYLVSADTTAGYHIRGPGNALIIEPGRKIGPVGSSIYPVHMEGGAAAFGRSEVGQWFEGAIVGSDGQVTSRFEALFGVVRHFEHTGLASSSAFEFYDFHNSRVEHGRVACVGASQNPPTAFYFDQLSGGSSGNLVRDLRAGGCSSLGALSVRGVVESLTGFSNVSGLEIGRNSVAADITVAHNHSHPPGSFTNGIFVGDGAILMHATAANNVGNGITTRYSAVVIGVASTQNWASGLTMVSGINPPTNITSTIIDAAIFANTHYGVLFESSNSGHRFSGGFYTGQNGGNPPTNFYTGMGCYQNGFPQRPNPGDCYGSRTTLTGAPDGLRTTTMAPFSCIADTNSDTVVIGLSGMGGFFRTRATDDPVNTSDNIDGLATFASITDWNNFEKPYMGWGAEGAATPDCFAQGACNAAAQGSLGCQVYDYSLRTSADQILYRPTTARPNGDNVVTVDFSTGLFQGMTTAHCQDLFRHVEILPADATHSYPYCRVTFLLHAREVLRDFIGNDNLLCESGETCLFTPNFASYQGHGPIIPSSGTFVDGVISNVSLVEYTTNGYPEAYRP